MDKVRVGVVGVGALGQHHARVYASLPGHDPGRSGGYRSGQGGADGRPSGHQGTMQIMRICSGRSTRSASQRPQPCMPKSANSS